MVPHKNRVEAAEVYLRHAYTIFLGLRACAELSGETGDLSYLPSVSLGEAKLILQSEEAAATAAGIDIAAQRSAAEPKAVAVAAALKRDPRPHVSACRRMGDIFQNDAANLGKIFQSLDPNAATGSNPSRTQPTNGVNSYRSAPTGVRR